MKSQHVSLKQCRHSLCDLLSNLYVYVYGSVAMATNVTHRLSVKVAD